VLTRIIILRPLNSQRVLFPPALCVPDQPSSSRLEREVVFQTEPFPFDDLGVRVVGEREKSVFVEPAKHESKDR